MSIVSKNLKSQKSGRSYELYEEVIQKNFQIIGQLLQKLNLVFVKHEEYEVELTAIVKRLCNLEADQEAIHNQHRRDSLEIQSNIHDLKRELNGIDNHMAIFFDQIKKGESIFNPRKTATLRERQNMVEDNITQRHSSPNSKHKIDLERREKVQPLTSINQSITFRLEDSPTNKQPQQNKNNAENLDKKQDEEYQTKFTVQQRSAKTLQKIQEQFINSTDNLPIEKDNHCSFYQSSVSSMRGRHSLFQYQKSIKKQASRKISSVISSVIDQKMNEVIKKKPNDVLNKKRQSKKISLLTDELSDLFIDLIGSHACHDQDTGNESSENYNSAKYDRIYQISEKLNSQVDNALNGISDLNLKVVELQKNNPVILRIQEEVSSLTRQSKNFATLTKLEEQTYGMLTKMKQLREDCHHYFANKIETKKAIGFLDEKIKKSIDFLNIEIPDAGEDGVVTSKCLGCNRTVIGKSQSHTPTQSPGHRTLDITETPVSSVKWRKKIADVLKNEKIKDKLASFEKK